MAIFDPAIFDNAIFDTPVAAPAATTTTGTGHWRGPARGGKRHRPGLQGRIRLLSELDEPLFTPEEVIEAPPAFNVDDEARAAIEKEVMAAFADVMDKAARTELQRKRREELLAKERELIDDDETFLMM